MGQSCRTNPRLLCPEYGGCSGACARMFDASATVDAQAQRLEHDRRLRERFDLGEVGEAERSTGDHVRDGVPTQPSTAERPQTPSERASALVNGPRQADYGHPLTNHERIAGFWNVRLRDKLKPGETIEPHEAAAMMRLVKEARLMQTTGHRDSLDDLAGYADVEWLIHERQAGRS